MPKVLGLVTFRIFPTHMGGQKGVALFYQYLSEHVEVILAVANNNQESPVVETRNILHENRAIYRNFGKLAELTSLIKEKDIDIIVAEHSYAGWIAYQLQKRTGKPIIIHSHNIESIRFDGMKKWWWKFYHRYEGWIHRKASFNFFISEEDMDFAVRTFGLSPKKCMVVTYGIERNGQRQDKATAKDVLKFPNGKIMLLFNGTLDYTPNYEAVIHLIEKVEPLLRNRIASFQIVITGNRAPKDLIQKMLAAQNLLYVGYVPDINLYYSAAELFLNPVMNNSGVKTKLIEAVGNNCTSVSTTSGASGLNRAVCGDKVITVADGDWQAFANSIIDSLGKRNMDTPEEFYNYYEWRNIAKKAAVKISEIVSG